MQITAEMCINLFSDITDQITFYGKPRMTACRVRFYEEELQEESLYVVTEDEWEKLRFSGQLRGKRDIVFFCLCRGEDNPPPPGKAETYSIFFLPPYLSLSVLYNRLADMLEKYGAGREEELQTFIKMISGSAKLHELCAQISRMFQADTAIMTGGFRLITASNMQDGCSNSSTWKYIHEQKHYPNLKTMNALQKMVYQMGKRTQPEVFHFSDSPEMEEYFIPVFADNATGALLGYLYFSTKKGTELPYDRNRTGLVSSLLSWRLWRYTNQTRHGDVALGILVTDILRGSIYDPAVIDRQMIANDITSATHWFLIVVESSSAEDEKYSLEHVKEFFIPIWNDACVMTYSSDILILIRDKAGCLDARDLAKLSQTLAQISGYAGISEMFREIDPLLRNRYIRALAAARMARSLKRTERYARYGEIAAYHLVHEGPPQFSLRELINPNFLHLLQQDKQHKTDYVYTLRLYWFMDKNIDKTCDYLHIHRNTLFYRLNKISETLDENVNSLNCYRDISISIAILIHFGDLEPLTIPNP